METIFVDFRIKELDKPYPNLKAIAREVKFLEKYLWYFGEYFIDQKDLAGMGLPSHRVPVKECMNRVARSVSGHGILWESTIKLVVCRASERLRYGKAGFGVPYSPSGWIPIDRGAVSSQNGRIVFQGIHMFCIPAPEESQNSPSYSNKEDTAGAGCIGYFYRTGSHWSIRINPKSARIFGLFSGPASGLSISGTTGEPVY